jgi:hypothetical protein
MKRFFKNFLGFITFFVCIAFLFDYGISCFLKQSNKSVGEYEVWNDIYNGNANCDLAVYGSSRAWRHINPKIISDTLNLTVYNFGIDGHNFWLQYLRHLEYLEHNQKPKTIILAIDVFSFQKREDLYNQNQFLPYMLWNKNIENFTSSYNGFRLIDYYIPLIRYYGKKSALNVIENELLRDENSERTRDLGFKGQDKEWTDDFQKAKRKIKTYTSDLDPDSILLFERFIAECKEKNIDLILVYTPEYIEGQEFIENRGEIVKQFQDYAIKSNLIYLDYSAHDISFDKSYFYNATHLNKNGANLFTQKLASDIKPFFQ